MNAGTDDLRSAPVFLGAIENYSVTFFGLFFHK